MFLSLLRMLLRCDPVQRHTYSNNVLWDLLSQWSSCTVSSSSSVQWTSRCTVCTHLTCTSSQSSAILRDSKSDRESGAMYIPGYVGGVTANSNLCLPQYVAFNSLPQQYRWASLLLGWLTSLTLLFSSFLNKDPSAARDVTFDWKYKSHLILQESERFKIWMWLQLTLTGGF